VLLGGKGNSATRPPDKRPMVLRPVSDPRVVGLRGGRAVFRFSLRMETLGSVRHPCPKRRTDSVLREKMNRHRIGPTRRRSARDRLPQLGVDAPREGRRCPSQPSLYRSGRPRTEFGPPRRCASAEPRSLASTAPPIARRAEGVRTIDPTSDRLAVVLAADGSQLLTGHCPIEVLSRIELELHP